MTKYKEVKDPVKRAKSTTKYVADSVRTGNPAAKKLRAKRVRSAVDSVSGAERKVNRPKLGTSPGLSDRAMAQAHQKRTKAKENKAKGKIK